MQREYIAKVRLLVLRQPEEAEVLELVACKV